MTYAIQQALHLPALVDFTSGEGYAFGLPELTQTVLGARPAPAPALTYLIRRFGYSVHGGDPHKALCEFILTTPEPDVFLNVIIKARTVEFYPMLPEAQFYTPDAECVTRVRAAMRTALDALKVPVTIRDVFLNIHGEMNDDDVPTQGEGLDEEAAEAPHHPTAGYGVPVSWLQDPLATLNRLDPGDAP